MRIDSGQLAQHLAKGLKPLYTLLGEEMLLAIEAADRIRAAALAAGHDERRVLMVESGFDWGELAMLGNSLSLFAPKRVIDLRIPSGKPGKEGSEALQALAARLPEDTIVMISLPGLDRQTQQSKWFGALESAGVLVHAAAVRPEHLESWLSGRLALQKQSADAATLDFLASRVEGNLMAAHQEMQKLALLFPEGPLPFEGVKNAVLDVARYDVFELGPALLRGERAHFVRMLDGLQGEGVAAPLVLWAIAEEARAMAKVRAALDAGQPLNQALRDARVWGPRQDLMPAAMRRLEGAALVDILGRAAHADRIIKGLESGDVWDALMQLGLSLMPAAPQGRGSSNRGRIGAGARS